MNTFLAALGLTLLTVALFLGAGYVADANFSDSGPIIIIFLPAIAMPGYWLLVIAG